MRIVLKVHNASVAGRTLQPKLSIACFTMCQALFIRLFVVLVLLNGAKCSE